MARKKTNLPDGYDKVFPTVLRGLMKDRGITQQMIADNIGKTRQAVGYYADGSSSPDWETLVKLAKFFSVSVDYLLGCSDVETRNENIQAVHHYTGLSQNAIATLHVEQIVGGSEDIVDFLNYLVCSKELTKLVGAIEDYRKSSNDPAGICLDTSNSNLDQDVLKAAIYKLIVNECFWKIVDDYAEK